MQNRRKIILIDKSAQLRIANMMMLYWIIGGALVLAVPVVLNMTCGLFLAKMSPWILIQNLLNSILFPLLAAIIVIPLGVRASIRLSHRIAGPMFRLRREMDNVAKGEMVQPIRLRKGDFFTDVIDSFNRLLVAHKQLKVRYEALLEATEGSNLDSSEFLLTSCDDDLPVDQKNPVA